jgi:Zn finger protein HypA/HybF involved in hydrogenase expression
MHEHHFIQNIIKDIPNKEKVKEVEIELGELVGIEEKHLKEHLEDETGWDIRIIEKKSKIRCLCGYSGPAKIIQRLHDMVIYECPNCGMTEVEVLEGDKIKILKVVYK